MSELKPCPFCGSEAEAHDGDSRYSSVVICTDCKAEGRHGVPVAKAIENWNRRTQPEAPKPAQDLGAAILALPLPETTLSARVAGFTHKVYGVQHMRDLLKAAAALASPADALVAGDRVDVITDTQRMDFQQANPHMYFNVDKRGKRWRFGHFSNYPQDCYGSAREALDSAIQAQKDGHG